jgi:hypothetical protein
MRVAVTPVLVAIALTSEIGLTQGAEQPMAQLRDCTPTDRAERLECPDNASRTIAAAGEAASKEDNWIISQTTSPVDYSPVVIATTMSHDDATESALKLSIRCRGRRAELVLEGPGITGRGDDYSILYRLSDGHQAKVSASLPTSGAGVAFGSDVVRLLQSFPDTGSLSVHLAPRAGPALYATFSLDGLDGVRARMSTACKWSQPVRRPSR